MGRKATGQAIWGKHPETGEPCWLARLTPEKGSAKRVLVPMPGGIAKEDVAVARKAAAHMSALYRGQPPSAVEGASETVAEWFARYYDAAASGEVGRKNRGKPQASAADRRARFKRWIEPEIGTVAMAAVTAADLRRIVRRLDEEIRTRATFYDRDDRNGRKPGLSAKTAQNVWSEVTNGFGEAVGSKRDELRVLTINPAKDVQPPTTGDDREQAALFPSEVIALLSCELVPIERRRLYAVAIYTGMRRSELVRLEAGDVDLEHETIRVRGKKTTAAKRVLPIEPAIRPLLEALVKLRPSGPLLVVPRGDGKGGCADLVRRDLERAGVVRDELSADDADRMPFTFHGLRHTCITHWTVAGRDQLFLLTAAGHTDVGMTRRYLAAASSLSAKFGTPHPALPAALLDGQDSGRFGQKDETPGLTPRVSRYLRRPQRELNPCYRRERPMS